MFSVYALSIASIYHFQFVMCHIFQIVTFLVELRDTLLLYY